MRERIIHPRNKAVDREVLVSRIWNTPPSPRTGVVQEDYHRIEKGLLVQKLKFLRGTFIESSKLIKIKNGRLPLYGHFGHVMRKHNTRVTKRALPINLIYREGEEICSLSIRIRFWGSWSCRSTRAAFIFVSRAHTIHFYNIQEIIYLIAPRYMINNLLTMTLGIYG